jgi:hypothetical protein
VIQSIIDGVVAALLDAFPDVTVYDEQVKQGLKEPCFIVQIVNPTNEQFLGNRYFRTNLFSVQYIPKSTTDAKAECNRVTDVLFQALEYITVGGDLQRGEKMRGEYFDGVLTFFVNFNMFVKIEPELDPMETLKLGNQAK